MFIRNEFIFPNIAIQISDATVKGVLKAFKRGNIVRNVFLRLSNTIPAVFMKNSPLYAILIQNVNRPVVFFYIQYRACSDFHQFIDLFVD